jgi:lipid II:glycine glycyltransferase (peptidoglycan interpeptide bridge formation enzyme)
LEFERIYRLAQRRKNFRGLDLHPFIAAHKQLPLENKLNLIVIAQEDKLLCVDVNSYLGDTSLGLFQSTTEAGLSLGASHLAWWTTFLAAKRAGMRRYDMGGVDPARNPSVYKFKTQMGGDEAFHLGCFEAYASAKARRIWNLADRFYSRAKGA